MRTEITKEGFTLIELMAVMAVMAILIGMLIPVVQKVMTNAQMAEAMNNGKSIYQSIQTLEMDDTYLLPVTTGTNTYNNSTDYWKHLVENKHLDATFEIFAAEGLNAAPGVDPLKFSADNNAWCIVQDVSSSTAAATPVMFTRNLDVKNINQANPMLSENSPFGLNGAVVVRRDGSVKKMRQGDLEEMFNPHDDAKVVLRP